MTEKIAGEPCLEHAYRVQLTSRTILSFSNVLVQSSGGSRHTDSGGGGGGSSRPRDNGWPGLKKNFSPPFGPYFRLKIRGGGGFPGPLRWIRRCSQWKTHQSGGVDALDAFSMTMKTQCGQCLS